MGVEMVVVTVGTRATEPGPPSCFHSVRVCARKEAKMSNGENEAANLRARAADPAAESAEPSGDAPPLTLSGYWDGKGRMYLTRDKRQYVQFDPDAVLDFGDLDPTRPPFLGDQATWVRLAAEEPIKYVQSGPAAVMDEFAAETGALDYGNTAYDVARRTPWHTSARYC
jgi:hypothetical protein